MTLQALMADLFERRCFGGLVMGRPREGLGGWWDRPEAVERGTGGYWTRLWGGLQVWEDGLGFTTQLTIVFLEGRRPRDPGLRAMYDTLWEIRVADLPEGAVLDVMLSDDESVHYRVGGVHIVFDREPERVFKIVVSGQVWRVRAARSVVGGAAFGAVVGGGAGVAAGGTTIALDSVAPSEH